MIEVKLRNEIVFKDDFYEWATRFEEISILSTLD